MKIVIGSLYMNIGQDVAPVWADELEGRIQKELREMAKTLEDTLALVREQRSQTGSLIALTSSIQQRLQDALSGASLPPAVQAKIDEIFNEVDAEKTEVANAINANTPAEDTDDGEVVEPPKPDEA